jgi:hypothetical protein
MAKHTWVDGVCACGWSRKSLGRGVTRYEHTDGRWATTKPRCGNVPPCERAKGYYVSAVDGPRQALVAGPFETHAEALSQVEPEREKWCRLDGRAHFAAWGTCRVGFKPGEPCGCPEPHRKDESIQAETVVRPVDPGTQFEVRA